MLYQDIFLLARSEAVTKAYEKFLFLRDSDYPDMCYFGLNFRKGEIESIKYYFSVYKTLSRESVLDFLPRDSDFFRYYHLWESTKTRSSNHTGCTFSVKFKGNNKPILGFHYRIQPGKKSYDLIGHPETLPFNYQDISSWPGINYEYYGGRSIRRRYYYLDSLHQKKYIAKRFDRPFAKKASMCEFTEAEEGGKVILWRFDHTTENMERPSYFDCAAMKVIGKLREDLGLINTLDGVYENKEVLSAYFFNTKGNNEDDIFGGRENFHMDTLRCLRC